MKETRVSKYQQYRKSISKKGSKGFFAPSKTEEVSIEMGPFLKLKKKRTIENVVIISVCAVIVLTLVIVGLRLF